MIDVHGTLARLGDDRKLLREMAQFVVEDTPCLLDDVEQQLKDENVEAVLRAVHSLKGLALNFGAKAPVEAAERLESAVRESGCAAAAAQLNRLRSHFRRFTYVVRIEVLETGGYPERAADRTVLSEGPRHPL